MSRSRPIHRSIEAQEELASARLRADTSEPKRSELAHGPRAGGAAPAALAGVLRRSDDSTRAGLAAWLQRSAGNGALTDLVAQREPEDRHMLHELHGGQAERDDPWNRKVVSVFGKRSYDEYIKTVLQAGTFFGETVQQLHPDLIDVLQKVEAHLKETQGAGYKVPNIDSGFRRHKGMHGWGMAVDFDVLVNPYVLNEEGESTLDEALKPAYDHVARFMLGDAHSVVGKLAQGRGAFGGSISDVYEALNRESGAMKRYFGFKDDPAALADFLANEWPATHPKQTPPDVAVIKAQMVSDYEILGGKTASGDKLPTDKGIDRPFAPVSTGGRGDPATGFLNLPKEFVQAMTDFGGLAWGAVDFGGASGDIQHFDLRLMGIGKRAYSALHAG